MWFDRPPCLPILHALSPDRNRKRANPCANKLCDRDMSWSDAKQHQLGQDRVQHGDTSAAFTKLPCKKAANGLPIDSAHGQLPHISKMTCKNSVAK